MNPGMSIEVDSSVLSARLLDLQAALIGIGKTGDLGTILEDESRKFCEGMVRLNPPHTKAQGENAIAADLRKVFTPIADDFLQETGSKHGSFNVDAWITSSVTKKPLHLKWDRIDPTGDGMEAWHIKNRNYRGRTLQRQKRGVEEWYSPYVVSNKDYLNYYTKVKSRVGYRKALWGRPLVRNLKGKVRSWVARHFGYAKGDANVKIYGENPTIEIRVSGKGLSEQERIVRDQFRFRTNAIGRRIKGILSGYSADWKAGLKIAHKARLSAAEEVE